MATPDDAHLDCCEHGLLEDDRVTSDDQIAAVVLFADVDFTNPAAVDARVAEWEALWPSG